MSEVAGIPAAVAPFVEIAKFGLLGSIVVILWFKLGERDKQLEKSWSERIADSKGMQQAMDGVQHAISSMNLQSENRTRSSDAVANALQASAIASQELSKDINRLTERLERVLESKSR